MGKIDRILGIDIGNTHTKLSYYSDRHWCNPWRLSTDLKRTSDEYRVLVGQWLHEAGISELDYLAISSVVPPLTPIFQRVGSELGATNIVEITPPGYGLTVLYHPPESLGSDRFLNALAAWRLLREDCIVVDMGTTVTVDSVSAKGQFLGGVIAPGLHFLMESLARGTAKLPLLSPELSEGVIGQSTRDGIAIGVGHGFIGMVNALITRSLTYFSPLVPVVVTGGWASRVSPHLNVPTREIPFLTMEGLRFALEWREGGEPQ